MIFVRRASAQGARGAFPNIVWISAEDLSPDLGCYGDSYAHTPNLDRFASQGLRYDRAFSVYGVCAPSRSSIITGQYPTAIGTCHMRSNGVPPPETRCFTEYLRERGYFCTNNVKTDYNFDPPLTAWDESSATAHWRNGSRERPFFSVFNFIVTHESQARPTPEQYQKNTAMMKPGDFHDPAKAVLPPYYPDTETIRKNWAVNCDNITSLDYQITRVLKDLEDDGLAGNTVVFFWGDHGRGLTRGKRWLYDSGIRVPLMVRWPGRIEPGTSTTRMVSLMDLGPTVLSIAGIEMPKQMHGVPFLGRHTGPERKYIYAARDRMDEAPDTIRAVRDIRYKYIRNYKPDIPYSQHNQYMDAMPMLQEMRRMNAEGKLTGAPALWFAPRKPEEELYDCDADPHEIRNLAADPQYSSKLSELRAEHERWKQQYGDLGLLPEPELMERARPGGKWQKTAQPAVTTIRSGDTLKVMAQCSSPGASIVWTTGSGNTARWNLYTSTFDAKPGTTVRVRAFRLGWLPSEETTAQI